MYIEINGTHYQFMRTFCEHDMIRLYEERNCFITEVPYSKDWNKVAEIALTQIQRKAA